MEAFIFVSPKCRLRLARDSRWMLCVYVFFGRHLFTRGVVVLSEIFPTVGTFRSG